MGVVVGDVSGRGVVVMRSVERSTAGLGSVAGVEPGRAGRPGARDVEGAHAASSADAVSIRPPRRSVRRDLVVSIGVASEAVTLAVRAATGRAALASLSGRVAEVSALAVRAVSDIEIPFRALRVEYVG
jgi:hypothetical protein